MDDLPEKTASVIAKKLLSPSGSPQIFTVTISQFREIYNEVQRNVQATPVDILLNGDWAMAQFSRLCNHRIRIVSDSPPKYLSWIVKRKILTERDFDFASLYSEFYGAKQFLSFGGFLVEEISTNWLAISLTLIISFLAFSVLMNVQNGVSALEKVIESVITAATLFLSIFILFTVSQNAELIKDQYLFREGLTHRFFRVDKLLASFALVALVFGILTLVIMNLPTIVIIFGKSLTMPNVKIVVPVFSAVSVAILVDCFLALVNYYFKRVRYVFEKDLAKNLFDDRWDWYKNSQNSAECDSEDLN